MQRFKKILFVCDHDGGMPAVTDHVRALAERNNAEVTLLDVVEGERGDLARLLSILPGARAEEVETQVEAALLDRLEEVAATFRVEGRIATCLIERGTPFLKIIQTVLRDDYDLVIKGAEGDGVRSFFGGTDMHLMRKCPCPVWILSSEAPPRLYRVLAAVDPDPEDRERDALNHTVMELATSLAARNDASLDVINVWRVQEESALRHGLIKIPEADIDAIVAAQEGQSAWRLNTLLTDFPDSDGRRRVVHEKGIPGDVIPAHVEAEDIDTVVMGTIGRSGVAGFFIGNTAETILGRVRCSVITVKPPHFVSPVVHPDSAA
ncbi:MAG: universal stress protein [Pseudomonadota bacterium]